MKPISPPQSVMELTALQIRDAIIQGELPLGSKVSEQKLADRLQVSRSPVREALALLQIEGLVRVLPRRGTFVFSPDEKSISDLCDHRAMLEAACLELALERNAKSLVGGLRQGMDRMQRAIAKSDSVAYASADLSFHRAIIQGSDNRSMAKVYDTNFGPLMALRTHLFTTLNAHLDRSMAEHAALLEACENNDLARAQAVASTHIRHLAEHFRASSAKSEPQKLKLVR